jgi:hypothetical protein
MTEENIINKLTKKTERINSMDNYNQFTEYIIPSKNIQRKTPKTYLTKNTIIKRLSNLKTVTELNQLLGKFKLFY